MIKIDKDFSIIADDNCYIVSGYYGKDKKGEDVYKNLTFEINEFEITPYSK